MVFQMDQQQVKHTMNDLRVLTNPVLVDVDSEDLAHLPYISCPTLVVDLSPAEIHSMSDDTHSKANTLVLTHLSLVALQLHAVSSHEPFHHRLH